MTKETKRYSAIANNYPSFQNIGSSKLSGIKWLNSRKDDDNAEGLWRVHDDLYDLTSFARNHPGGADWIQLTHGTDITEAFEVHHLNFALAESKLKQFFVRKAKAPRNFKLTFKNDGFYRTLRRRIAAQLRTMDQTKAENLSKFYIDSLLFLTFVMTTMTVKFDSRLLMLISSLCLCYTIIAAHNFFHRRDNFRMYYFNLGLFNYRDWRISHSLSHHLYPNSLHDMEVSFFEPFLCWIPDGTKKKFVQRYMSWVYSPVVYGALFIDQFVKKSVSSIFGKKNLFDVSDLIPFSVPLMMYMFGNPDLANVMKYWFQILITASFIFGLIGLNAGHHHPDLVHDGDKIREDKDWGIYSMDTIMDNTDLRRHALSLTHFGHHAMHHLFPTVDHGILNDLYPTLFETMNEFEVELGEYPWYHHIYGQLRQLARIEPNPLDSLQKLRQRKLQRKLEKFD